jgi:drug/metabolite transporter (DMT)-like permease
MTAGILIVFIQFIMCIPMHKYEKFGTIVVFLGCVLLVYDPKAAKADGNTASILGDLYAFISSAFYAIYLICSRKLILHLPKFIAYQLVTQNYLFKYFWLISLYDIDITIFTLIWAVADTRSLNNFYKTNNVVFN